MPGHIRHGGKLGFEHVYLSYHDPAILPSTEFDMDFPPDAKFLYRRGWALDPSGSSAPIRSTSVPASPAHGWPA